MEKSVWKHITDMPSISLPHQLKRDIKLKTGMTILLKIRDISSFVDFLYGGWPEPGMQKLLIRKQQARLE